MNKFFSLTDTFSQLVEKYPEAMDCLVANGFEQFKNKQMFDTMGKTIRIDMALKSKKINPELFEERLVAFLEKDSAMDISLAESKKDATGDILIEGVLPCPIRIPLLEGIKEWVDDQNAKNDYKIAYELQSANLGLDWVVDKVKTGDADKVSDVLLSAGFELFFDKDLMGHFMDEGIFETYLDEMNKDFCNDRIDLRDPKKRYAIMGVVPAVFLVNKGVLGDRKVPETWADILSEEFEDSVALPMNDLDLFNALVINIYKEFGSEGIKNLARSYKKNLHPAQMVKAKGKSKDAPAVSIIPYFFTQMLMGASDLQAVWPKDGALLSPIFMITKKAKHDKIKPFIDFFMSEKIGTLFSASGKFPSTNPNVDNHLDENQTFKWIGWDFIHNNDVGGLVRQCEKEFNDAIMEL